MPIGEGFETVVKHLDITPAVESPDGISQTRVNHQPPVINPSRDIKKNYSIITLPTIGYFGVGVGRLMFQANYTASKPFRILGVIGTSGFNDPTAFNYIRCSIRYRIGNTVFRYLMPTSNNPVDIAFLLKKGGPVFTIYNNQVIMPNFSIELWQIAGPLFSFGFASAPQWKISILSNPNDVNNSSFAEILPLEELTHTDLAVNLPEALPTVYSDSSTWLTN